MYKDLMINRDNIEQAINLYCKDKYSEYSIAAEQQGEYKIRYNIIFDGNKMFLDVFFNNKGGTTLQVTNGKFTDVKEELAEFIVTNPLCIMSLAEEHNRDMLFKKIEQSDFEKTLEIIKEDDDCKTTTSQETTEDKIVAKLEGRWSDKVTVTYTFATKNVRIQGRPLILFNLCASFFNELLDVDEVVECLENTYSLSLSGKSVEEQYMLLLPKSHDKHSEKLKKSLLKAVYNLNLDQQEYTCTELTFEVLRALEGHIKLTLLNDYSITSPNKHGTLSMFSYNRDTGVVTLSTPCESTINDPVKIQYYKDAYKHYVVFRHKIFHWDYPDDISSDDTEQLENIEDVRGIIRDTLAIIDRYY